MVDVHTSVHAGRTYAYTPYTRIKDVSVSCVNTHLVFEIPNTVFRPGAISFSDFNTDTYSVQYRKLFLFFLDFVYRLGTASKKDDEEEEFENIVTILEYDDACHRIHVFSNRKADVYTVLKSHLKSNLILLRKLKFTEPHQKHLSINSCFDYVTKVCNVYSKSQKYSRYMDDALGHIDDGHVLHPTQIFHINNTSITNMDAYYSSDTYKFPDETRILRLPPTFLMPECFYNRYFPRYYKNNVASPEAIIYEENQSIMVNLTECAQRLSVESQLVGDNMGGGYWRFPMQQYQSTLNTLRDNGFRIMASNSEENTHGSCYAFFKSTPVFEGNTLEFEDCVSFSNASEHIIQHDPILEHKASLSDHDLLKKRGEIIQKCIPGYRQYQKHLMREFVNRCWKNPESRISDPGTKISHWRWNRRPSDLRFQFPKYDIRGSIHFNRVIRLLQQYDKLMFITTAQKELYVTHLALYNAYTHVMGLHFNILYAGEGGTGKSFVFERRTEMAIPGTVQELTYQTTRADAVQKDNNHTCEIFHEIPPCFIMDDKHTSKDQASSLKQKITSSYQSCKYLYFDDTDGTRKQATCKSQCIGVIWGCTNYSITKIEDAMAQRFYKAKFESVRRPGVTNNTQNMAYNSMGDVYKKKRDQFLMFCHDEQMKVYLVEQMIWCGIIKDVNMKVADQILYQIEETVHIAARCTDRMKILIRTATIVAALEALFSVPGAKYYAQDFDEFQLLDIEPLLVASEEITLHIVDLLFDEVRDPCQRKVLDTMWNLHSAAPIYMESSDMRINYNYIKLNRMGRLCSQLASNMTESVGKMSPSNIAAVIKSMGKDCVYTTSYTLDAEKTFQDNFPQPDDATTRRKMESVIFEDGSVYIHIHLFSDIRYDRADDIVETTFRKLQHKYTARRPIILGRPSKEHGVVRNPQVFRHMEMEANSEKIQLIKQGNDSNMDLVGLDSQNMSVPLMGMTYDMWGDIQRSLELGYDTIEAGVTMGQVDAQSNYPNQNKVYPRDFKDENVSRKRSLTMAEASAYRLSGLMKKYCRR